MAASGPAAHALTVEEWPANGLEVPHRAAHANRQIQAANVIFARHYNQGPLCSCNRVEPCSARLHVLRRLRHFEGLLSALDAPTVLMPAMNGALVGEIVWDMGDHR
ncbi:MAG: hypothetical protein GEU94_10100 [Micromonosporaceae bacterium]|nr:hypothetical protein [Micromonosporaceae bacterium]